MNSNYFTATIALQQLHWKICCTSIAHVNHTKKATTHVKAPPTPLSYNGRLDFFQINIHFWVEGRPLFSSFSSLGVLLSKMLLKYVCLDTWGDLLRSVLNIKYGVKFKSHRYIDNRGWIQLICSAHWQNYQRPLLFESQKCFTELSKFVCHTVQNRFWHFTGSFQSGRGSICFKIIRNFLLNILHVSDFKPVSK